jgi:DNA helicase HerA-like ATPase
LACRRTPLCPRKNLRKRVSGVATDFEIGRVVAVDTAQVVVELNADLKSFTRSTYEGVEEIGRINSYVVLPVGARRLVAMVTRVSLTEEAEIKADRTMVSLPSARRILKATLIGGIEGNRFLQGISTFPVLDNPVLMPAADDLNAMFGCDDKARNESEDPGFCVEIGQSAVFEDKPILVNPDKMFSKHLAILGSTGSGKSCTVTTIIQAILCHPDVKRTNFVILDTNGEYRTAFQKQNGEAWEEAGEWRSLYIPSEPGSPERLVIPYWFLNSDDFVRLFRAREGVQRPVLLEALRLARNTESAATPAVLREKLLREFNIMLSLAGSTDKSSKDLRNCAAGLKNLIEQKQFKDAWATLEAGGLSLKDATDACEAIRAVACKHIENNTYPMVLPADARDSVEASARAILDRLVIGPQGRSAQAVSVSADAPAYFAKMRFKGVALEQVLQRQESGGAKARDYCGTMLLRIDRLLADPRFEFMLGPRSGGLPNGSYTLASFIRDVVGLPSAQQAIDILTNEEEVPKGVLPFYDRQRQGAGGANVVVLDLSLLASEVLENVTALVGRLILEFLQRLGELDRDSRGSLPVVLVLDEAQNYIAQRAGEEESVSRAVFERIAREGRKFGLSLLVASQRPSELSKTVLSQCSSFIVHRLQNPEDLRYFREVVPAIYGDLLAQLPALAPQTALILGECVRAPSLVQIRDADPLPRSKDPRFWSRWSAETDRVIPVERVCSVWESDGAPGAISAAGEQEDMGTGEGAEGR